MMEKNRAKTIAGIVVNSRTVEEMALKFEICGLNFPADPYTRCKLVTSYVIRKKDFSRNMRKNDFSRNAVFNELVKTYGSSTQAIKAVGKKTDEYAKSNVDLTDDQANQIFFDLVETSNYYYSRYYRWKQSALIRYWHKIRSKS